MTSTTTRSVARTMLNKVPEVTIFFWVIKILATTVGETAADNLATNLGLGLTGTTWVMGAVLVVVLFFQFRLRRYVPLVYWLAVVLLSIVGTLITDNLTDKYDVALATTTTVFAIALALVFLAWYLSERTLSIHTIFTTRREGFYWLAILFTFAFGTAAGDYLAETLDIGYWKSALLFGGAIVPAPQRDPGVLAGVHPHPPVGGVARRLPLAAEGRRWARSRDEHDDVHLPCRHTRGGGVPDREQARPGTDSDRCPRGEQLTMFHLAVTLALSLDPKAILDSLSPYGEIGLMLIIFAETGLLVGFFLPGDSLMFTAGLLASQGSLNLALVLGGCFAAAVIGDQVGFTIGEVLGPRVGRTPDAKIIKPEYIERTHAFFDRHGPKTIVLARFVPIVRTFTPVVAGVARMRRSVFLRYNVVGAGLWVAVVTLLGYLLADLIGDSIDTYLLPIIGVVVLVSLVPPLLEWRRHRSSSSIDDGSESSS